MTEETKIIMDELKKLNDKITDIQLTLENETNRNIKIIAEGHLDLSRKLDEALKNDNEKEMLLIRVNRLENEIRRLKSRVEEMHDMCRGISPRLFLFMPFFQISKLHYKLNFFPCRHDFADASSCGN